jgi:hypothetical protein
VHDRFGLLQEPVQVRADLGGEEPEPVDQAQRRVWRRRGALGDGERATLVDRDQVGEGTADVDTDTVASAQSSVLWMAGTWQRASANRLGVTPTMNNRKSRRCLPQPPAGL